jgi:serine/threonine protein kinase
MSASDIDEGSMLSPGDLVAGAYVVDAVAHEQPACMTYRGHRLDREDERVAIACLRHDAPSAGYVEAFAKRSQWLGAVRLPCVPPLLASGVELGCPVIVTPWTEGVSLRARLASEGSIPREEALRILRAIAESLDAMHGLRPIIVHQLLSLESVLVDPQTGAVTLQDAGLAHALRHARVEDVRAAAGVEGVFVAPEDIAGRTPTTAIDRFALAKLAEALLSPVLPGTPLARVCERGAAPLAISRFPTCMKFVQSLEVAVQNERMSLRHFEPDLFSTAERAALVGALGAASSGASASSLAISSGPERNPTPSAPSEVTATARQAIPDPPPEEPSLEKAPVRPEPSQPAVRSSPPIDAVIDVRDLLEFAPSPPPPPPVPRPPPLPRTPAVGTSRPGKSTLLGLPVPSPLPTPGALQRAAVAPTASPPPADDEFVVGDASILDVLEVDAPDAPENVHAPAPPETRVPASNAPADELPLLIDDEEEPPTRVDVLLSEPSAVVARALPPEASPSLSSVAGPDGPATVTASPVPSAPMEPPRVVSASTAEEASERPLVDFDSLLSAEAPAAPALPSVEAPTAAPDLNQGAATIPAETPARGEAAGGAESAGPSVGESPVAESPVAGSPVAGSTTAPEPLPTPDAGPEITMEVPPLFEVGPPVPAPILPDQTASVRAVRIDSPRRSSRALALGVATIVGLGVGLGGVYVWQRSRDEGPPTGADRGGATATDQSGFAATDPRDAGLVRAAPAEGAAMGTGYVSPSTEDAARVTEDAARAAVEAAPDASAMEDVGDASVAPARDADVLARVVAPPPSADAGAIAATAAGGPAAEPGVLVVEGPSGLRDPDFRVRRAARRAMSDRVGQCADGTPRMVRIIVRFEGATGRLTEFTLVGAQVQGTPFAACVERAARSVQLPPFRQRAWDTDYAIPLR